MYSEYDEAVYWFLKDVDHTSPNFETQLNKLEHYVYAKCLEQRLYGDGSLEYCKRRAKETARGADERARMEYIQMPKFEQESVQKNCEILDIIKNERDQYLENVRTGKSSAKESLDEFEKRIYDTVYNFYMDFYKSYFPSEKFNLSFVSHETADFAKFESKNARQYCEKRLKENT